MGLHTPFSGKRRYLRGIDWTICATDYPLRRITGSGNTFLIAIEFDSPIDKAVLRERLAGFLSGFPFLGGRVSRALNLAPYWKAPGKSASREDVSNRMPLRVHRVETAAGNDGLYSIIEAALNEPFNRDNEHIAFHLVLGSKSDRNASGKCHLLLVFDHKLFDARGAEVFLEMFRGFLFEGEKSGTGNRVRTSEPPGLTDWTKKFRAGKTVNRMFIELSKHPIRALPIGRPRDSREMKRTKFRVFSFDRGETSRILENAQREAGFLMETPYFLATVAYVMHGIFQKKGTEGESYVIPVTLDTRSAEKTVEDVFFNHASFFFFRVMAEAPDRELIIKSLKEQMYEQVKMRFPEQIEDAAMLLRILPLAGVEKANSLFFRGERFSYSFSYLGKSHFSGPEVLGARVKNLFHVPHVPIPPGAGVFFNLYDGRLNVTSTWIEDQLDEEDLEMLEQGLREML